MRFHEKERKKCYEKVKEDENKNRKEAYLQ